MYPFFFPSFPLFATAVGGQAYDGHPCDAKATLHVDYVALLTHGVHGNRTDSSNECAQQTQRIETASLQAYTHSLTQQHRTAHHHTHRTERTLA